MKHCLETKEGKFIIDFKMQCGHPELKDNHIESVGCNGNCCSCKHSRVSCTLPELFKLIELAECAKSK